MQPVGRRSVQKEHETEQRIRKRRHKPRVSRVRIKFAYLLE